MRTTSSRTNTGTSAQPENPQDPSALTVKASAVNDQVNVLVNEVERSAAEIDTDPYIYAIGTELADGGVVTAVLPRAELERITIAFMTRQ